MQLKSPFNFTTPQLRVPFRMPPPPRNTQKNDSAMQIEKPTRSFSSKPRSATSKATPKSLSERFSAIASGKRPQATNSANKRASGVVKMTGIEMGAARSSSSKQPRSAHFRRGRGKFRRGPLKKENLDADLERYMMRDAQAGKTLLDADLDEYMKDAAVVATA